MQQQQPPPPPPRVLSVTNDPAFRLQPLTRLLPTTNGRNWEPRNHVPSHSLTRDHQNLPQQSISNGRSIPTPSNIHHHRVAPIRPFQMQDSQPQSLSGRKHENEVNQTFEPPIKARRAIREVRTDSYDRSYHQELPYSLRTVASGGSHDIKTSSNVLNTSSPRPLSSSFTSTATTKSIGTTTTMAIARQQQPLHTEKKRARYLRDTDRRTIIQRIENGEKQATLAREFGVTRAAICHIKKNKEEIITRYDLLVKSAQDMDKLEHNGETHNESETVRELRSQSVLALLTTLRDRTSDPVAFRRASGRIIMMLLEEALASGSKIAVRVTTPGGHVVNGMKRSRPVCGITLGALGCPMLKIFSQMEPDAPKGSIQIQEVTEDHGRRSWELAQMDLPNQLAQCHVLLLLATCSTGENACIAIEALCNLGIEEAHICMVTIVCASEGVERISSQFPEVKIITTAVDAHADMKTNTIVPGIGDFAMRFNINSTNSYITKSTPAAHVVYTGIIVAPQIFQWPSIDQEEHKSIAVGRMFALTRLARAATTTTVVRSHQAVVASVAAYSTPTYVAPPRISKDTHYRFGLKLDDPMFQPADGEPESAELKQLKAVLSLSNASQHELNKAQIAKAIEIFQRFPGDTGSSEVQIAVLTQKILRSTTHAQGHKKDHHSRRGLIAMVEKRRKLLKYLRRKDLHKFRAVVAALGLRFS